MEVLPSLVQAFAVRATGYENVNWGTLKRQCNSCPGHLDDTDLK